MPRILERLQVLKDIEEAVESAVVTLVVSPLTRSNRDIEDHISILFALHDGISSTVVKNSIAGGAWF